MAGNNFKVDLSGMVREIQEMNRAMEQLGQVAQGVFTNLGRAADTFGTKMNSAQGKSSGSIILPGQEQMLSSRGQEAMSEATERSGEALRLQRKMAKDPGGYITNAEDQIMRKTAGASGTIYTSTGFDNQSLKKSIQSAQYSAHQSQNNQFGTLPAGFSQKTNEYKLAPGYNQGDIPRVLGLSKNVGGMSSKIESLTGKTEDANIKSALTFMQTQLKAQNDVFTTALANYNTSLGEGGEAQRKATSELTVAMRDLENTVDKSSSNIKEAGNTIGGDGSGGGGKGGFLQGLMSPSGRMLIGGVGALGMAAFNAGVGGMQAYGQATYGKQMERDEATAGLATKNFKNLMDSHDMNKAENLLKYRGDMIFPGQFDYLGSKGMQNAMGVAGQMSQDKVELMRGERMLSMGNAVAGMAVAGFGGTMAGSLLGPGGAIVGGAAGLISGAGNVYKSYIGSEYTALQGGAGEMAQRAKQAQLANERFSNAQMLQDLEIQRNPNLLLGTQERLDRNTAIRSGFALVGMSAAQGNLSKTISPAAQRIRDRADAQAARTDALESQIKQRIPLVLSDEGGRYAPLNIATNLDKFNNPEERAAQLKLNEGLGAAVAKSRNSIKDQQGRAIQEAGRVRDTFSIGLGMSEADFIGANNQLTDAMGTKASASQTNRLLRMSLGGLGSAESLMSSLTSLNRVSGGQDNSKMLEQIMAAGVSAGFDKSRVATQFVQTTLELTKSLNMQAGDAVALSLTAGASVISQTGVVDERTLGLAAKGMSELGAYTGSSSGSTGAMKMMGIYGAGGQLGSGGGILVNSNSEELIEFQKELSGTGKLSDKAMDVVRLLGGDTPENRKRALSQVGGALRGSTIGLESLAEGSFNQNKDLQKKYGVKTLTELMSRGKDFKGAQKRGFIEDMVSLGAETAQSNNQSREMGQMMMTQRLQTEGGLTSVADVNLMNSKIAGASRAAVNPAAVEMQRFVQGMLQTTNAKSSESPLGRKEYQDYLKAGGGATLRVGNDIITDKALREAEAKPDDAKAQEFLAKADQEISKMSRFDLATQAGASADATARNGSQRVYVENLYQISQFMRPLDGATNPNTGN